MESVRLLIELYVVVVVVDVLLGILQPDASRWPRRATHAVTEPLERPIRGWVGAERTGGLDMSPLILVVVFGLLRVGLLSW